MSLKMTLPDMGFGTMSFLKMGVCAVIVASYNLLNACIIRQTPVAFFIQKVGLECGDRLSRT